jgi:hypothetical protein
MSDQGTEDIAQQLICVGNRAVTMERYLLRRAWGIYYAIWALSILFFIYIPVFLNPIKSVVLQDFAFTISYGIVIAVASYFSGLTFRKIARTAKLQRALSKPPKLSLKDLMLKYSVLIVLFLLVILLATGFFRSLHGVCLEAAILAIIPFYIYRGVSQSLGKVPVEAILAIGVFLFSDLGSAVSIILTRGAYYYPEFWVPTVIAWFLASIFSFANSGEELLHNINQEECN